MVRTGESREKAVTPVRGEIQSQVVEPLVPTVGMPRAERYLVTMVDLPPAVVLSDRVAAQLQAAKSLALMGAVLPVGV